MSKHNSGIRNATLEMDAFIEKYQGLTADIRDALIAADAMRAELIRLKEIVCPVDVESIDRVLKEAE